MWRLGVPTKKYAANYFIDMGNAALVEHGWSGFGGAAFFLAVLASGDIIYRAPNPRFGEVLKLGLDLYSGAPCQRPNAWRAIVAGTAWRAAAGEREPCDGAPRRG